MNIGGPSQTPNNGQTLQIIALGYQKFAINSKYELSRKAIDQIHFTGIDMTLDFATIRKSKYCESKVKVEI